ncbi:GDSL esterase/lipase [Striga hermonthica]|uniref:GDSL esterase/lipase n=1 Tax=Striga hermonthica TaxID=68872 RepID=A0A9N7RGR0_STRHE|nr:GDSL esterase/lipase [Striga hermonthica]
MDTSCSSYFPKLAIAFLFLFVGTISSQNTVCPYQYLYHLGDGVTDVGNSIRVLPWGPSLPAARLPYGRSYPGYPTGRWGDGLIDFDFAAADFGFPRIVPYLTPEANSSNGVIFSVARSPVLDHKFFKQRGVKIPPYVIPLYEQLNWFRTHLKSVCGSNCANRLANSLILLGDIEANDIGYSLLQGKSINEARTYVPYITQAQINVTRELISMGARQLIIPGNAPIGCFPYILTAFPSNDPKAYDEFGCLKSVNDLMTFKNNDLQQAIAKLRIEFPDVSLFYGPNKNNALKACCGIGGKYNFNSKSGEKKHVFAGIAIVGVIFGVPWYLMNQGAKHQSHQDYMEKADKARSARLSASSSMPK